MTGTWQHQANTWLNDDFSLVVLCHPPDSNCLAISQATIMYKEFEKYSFTITHIFQGPFVETTMTLYNTVVICRTVHIYKTNST